VRLEKEKSDAEGAAGPANGSARVVEVEEDGVGNGPSLIAEAPPPAANFNISDPRPPVAADGKSRGGNSKGRN